MKDSEDRQKSRNRDKNHGSVTYRTSESKNTHEVPQQKQAKTRMIIVLSAIFIVLFFSGMALTFHLFGSENKEETSTNGTGKEGVAAVTGPIASEKYEKVINRTYPIKSGYIGGSGELISIEGEQLEKEAAVALGNMLADMRGEGLDIILQSAYRTNSEQKSLYNSQFSQQGGDKKKAATISAVPLTSEHQAGLAVDLSVDGNLNSSFGATPQGKWLAKHCVEYGFILRYPKDKMEITGIIWEPWHFRFVGSPEVAKQIEDSGKCMEEYYGKYLSDKDLKPYLPYLQ